MKKSITIFLSILYILNGSWLISQTTFSLAIDEVNSVEFGVQYSGIEKIAGNIELYNLYGRMVKRESAVLEKGGKIPVDVSSMQEGVYILTVKDNEGKIIKVRKVVVNSTQ